MSTDVYPVGLLHDIKHRRMYVALTAEGFSVPEAMQVIGATIAASFQGGTE